MRGIEDKGNYSSDGKGSGASRTPHHLMALGKPTPSKWDDAQKWLVGLSRGGETNFGKAAPRNSNADDRRLIAPVPQKEQDYLSGDDEVGEEKNDCSTSVIETKTVDYDESVWGISRATEDCSTQVRSIYVREMGTEMTPTASHEPSRTSTPIRSSRLAATSYKSTGSTTSSVFQNGVAFEGHEEPNPSGRRSGVAHQYAESNACKEKAEKILEQAKKLNNLEDRASAWDEAERAKYMARYKREEVNIQAWENHEKRKAEMEMKRMEVKAERLKARSQERFANKLAATTRIAEEKRANAEAKMNEKAVKTSETADYIRRTGHMPSTFSFKLPSLCW